MWLLEPHFVLRCDDIQGLLRNAQINHNLPYRLTMPTIIVQEPNTLSILDGRFVFFLSPLDRKVDTRSHPSELYLGAAEFSVGRSDNKNATTKDFTMQRRYNRPPRCKVHGLNPNPPAVKLTQATRDDPDWRTGKLDAMDEGKGNGYFLECKVANDAEEVAGEGPKEEEREGMREQRPARMKVLGGGGGQTRHTAQSPNESDPLLVEN